MKSFVASIVFGVLLGAATSPAADYHVTPQGAGDQDGSGWANAMPKSEIESLLSERLKPGDRMLLGSGVYTGRPRVGNTLMVLRRGGTAGQPIAIEGIDTGGGLPEIQGRWSETNPRYHAHSDAAIALAEGIGHLRIAGLHLSHCMHGIRVAGGSGNVEIDNLVIDHGREGMTLKGLRDSSIRNCKLSHYTKRGIRFRGGCESLRISDVTADSSGGEESWPTENFPIGFSIEDGPGNRAIRYERCTARNNLHQFEPDEYFNGDGFNAESPAAEISYYDCLAVNNNDGGWDDKSLGPVLVNCVSIRNKRAFRFWNSRGDAEHPARLTNCLGVASRSPGGTGSACGLWLSGAVEADRCTLHNNASCAVEIDRSDRGASLVARSCIFSADRSIQSERLVRQEPGTRYAPEGVALWKDGVEGVDPQYAAPTADWSGTPADAFNNGRYGREKGYFADN